jgi:hypothetical protein
MLERKGREPEAEQVWRGVVAADELCAVGELAALLDRQGRGPEADQVRQGIQT